MRAERGSTINREGYLHGPKSKPVRQFMLDPQNYELEYRSTNRSRGARTPERYRDPGGKTTPVAEPQPKAPEEER